MLSKLFRKAREARSLENPSISIADPAALEEIFGLERTESGVIITETTAQNHHAVFRATSLIAGDLARLPLFYYRQQGDNKTRAKDQPLYRMLHASPAPNLTSFQWRFQTQSQALLLGNGYTVIRRELGKPVALRPLDAAVTHCGLVDGRLWYITTVDTQDVVFPAEDVIHIRGPGKGLMGDGVITHARESIGVALSAEKAAGAMMKHGVRPSLGVHIPGRLSEEAHRRLKQAIEEMNSGVKNAGRVLILEEGAQLNPFAMSKEDAQFLGILDFDLIKVANFFGVPPHKIGHQARTSYSSLEQENQSYLDSLDPWLVQWEQELELKLLSSEQLRRQTHTIEFNRGALIATDIQSQANFFNTGVLGGWLNRDEARAKLNLNPMPKGEGAKFLMPANMVVVGEEPIRSPSAASPPPPPEEGEDETEEGQETETKEGRRLVERFRPALEDLFRRGLHRLGQRAAGAAGKAPVAFPDWLERDLERKHTAPVRALAEPFTSALGLDAGEITNPLVTRAVAAWAKVCESATPAELRQAVEAETKRLETTLPKKLVEDLWPR